jgi:hypothetical protein
LQVKFDAIGVRRVIVGGKPLVGVLQVFENLVGKLFVLYPTKFIYPQISAILRPQNFVKIMEEFLCNTIDNVLRKVELVNNKARRDCLTKILLGTIKSKLVLFPAIADEIKAKAKKVLSKEEYKFFKLFVFDFQKVCLLLLSFLPFGKLDLKI